MNFNEFMGNFAAEIGGKFQEYDSNKSVIIVPLDGGRFQAVLGHMKYSEKYRKTGIEFTSKVCEYQKNIDLIELLEENSNFCHAKFVLIDGFIKVEASAFIDHLSEELLKEIISEVAHTADEWEYRLTGQDVH